MKRARLLVAITAGVLSLAGCQSERDVRKPLQEHLIVSGRILGFALDAHTEALETRLALVENDPKLEARLGSPAEIRKKIDRMRQEQLALQAELKALKDRYPLEGD